jgi:hypothetical protein
MSPERIPTRPVIYIDGQAQSAMANDLLELNITNSIDDSSRCEMVLSNWAPQTNALGYPYLSNPSLDFGKELKITHGSNTLFVGPISAMTAEYPHGNPPRIRFRADDYLLFRGRRTQSRHFENKTSSDIFKKVIADCSLISKISGTLPNFKSVMQTHETDSAFLYRLAAMVGAEVQVNGTTVSIKKPAVNAKVTKSPKYLTYGSTLQGFTVVADIANQFSKFKIRGWDPESKNRFDRLSATAIPWLPIGARTGPSIVESLGFTTPQTLTGTPTPSESEAGSLADIHFLANARRFVTGSGIADASVAMIPGLTLQLDGLGTVMNGIHHVTSCQFLFDSAQGARWNFETERSYLCP